MPAVSDCGLYEKNNPGCVATAPIAANHACCEASGLGLRKQTLSLNRRKAMGSLHWQNGRREGQRDAPSTGVHVNHFDVDALREENKQLRELVVQLSEIVVRNALERK
jgi:hypothetical protein